MNNEDHLHVEEDKDLLRFCTAGSVDDGKSTLIGRLLHDSMTLFDDHILSLKKDSLAKGSVEGQIDYALLLDGLKAEREQNITIDVSYRYFSTPKRKFIIADSPGHEQYTRNMVTGASSANMAVLIIDATKGMLTQTKRHTLIMSLLDIRHYVVVVNKMDLVDYNEMVFEKIRKEFIDFSIRLDLLDIHFIPISALLGDNVVEYSKNMSWYKGGPLLEYLENVHIASDRNYIDLRFPVQRVLRPHRDFRGYAGNVASGVIRRGDSVVALPSGFESRVKRIITYDGELSEAFPPLSIIVELEDQIDVSRGDMLVHKNNLPNIDNSFEAMIVWMNSDPLKCDMQYIFKHTTSASTGKITSLLYKMDINTLHRVSDINTLEMNEIGRGHISLNSSLHFDYYKRNRQTGSFIIIDRMTNMTVGAGIIIERRSSESSVVNKKRLLENKELHIKTSSVPLDDRIARYKQKPSTLWFTGLPKSGKSTIAFALEKWLFDAGYIPMVIDGENMRLGVSDDLGFISHDRSENVRRAAEIAKMCNDFGLIIIAAFVSPTSSCRKLVREIVGIDRFFDFFVDTPIELCEKRDVDGLYEKARNGDISNFSGVTEVYEPPFSPSLIIDTQSFSVDEVVSNCVEFLFEHRIIARKTTNE